MLPNPKYVSEEKVEVGVERSVLNIPMDSNDVKTEDSLKSDWR